MYACVTVSVKNQTWMDIGRQAGNALYKVQSYKPVLYPFLYIGWIKSPRLKNNNATI